MLVIFDLDGTLVDTTRRYAQLIAGTIKGLPGVRDNLDIIAEKDIVTRLSRSDIAGARAQEKLQKLDAEYGTDLAVHSGAIVPILHENKAHTYHENCAFDGVGEALATLRDYGHALAVASSADPHSLNYAMQVTGLDAIIGKAAFGCSDDTPKKPDPSVLYKARDYYDTQAGQIVYVGDSIADMQAARAADMWAVGYIAPNVGDHNEARDALYNAGAHDMVHHHREIRAFIDVHLPMLRERARYLKTVKAH